MWSVSNDVQKLRDSCDLSAERFQVKPQRQITGRSCMHMQQLCRTTPALSSGRRPPHLDSLPFSSCMMQSALLEHMKVRGKIERISPHHRQRGERAGEWVSFSEQRPTTRDQPLTTSRKHPNSGIANLESRWPVVQRLRAATARISRLQGSRGGNLCVSAFRRAASASALLC